MRLLALDPGRKSGWALTEPWLSGQIDHEDVARTEWWTAGGERTVAAWKRLPNVERLKRCLACGERWLEELCETFGPHLIVIEAQDSWGRVRAMESMLSWRACYLATAGRLDIALIEAPIASWQAGGRKNWTPEDPLADQKSAEAIRAWAMEQERLREVA